MQFNKTSISNSRRKLLYWAAGTFSGLLFWRFKKHVPKQESSPIKMLTEDGQLVEVDPRFLAGGGRKITKEEMQSWIKPKS